MWNVYGSTVLFYSCAAALNIVSIESGRSEVVSNEEYINKGRQLIEFDSQSADASTIAGGHYLCYG